MLCITLTDTDEKKIALVAQTVAWWQTRCIIQMLFPAGSRASSYYYTILYINYHYCYYCCYGDSNIMILRNGEYSFRVIVASERIDNGKGETHVLQFIIILDFYVHAIVALAATIGHCRKILKSVRVHRWHGKTLHIITRTCLLKEMFVTIYCTNAKKGKKNCDH